MFMRGLEKSKATSKGSGFIFDNTTIIDMLESGAGVVGVIRTGQLVDQRGNVIGNGMNETFR